MKVTENGAVGAMLARTGPGMAFEPATVRELLALVDALAIKAARTDEERMLAERVAARGAIRVNERAVFFSLLMQGADTEETKELVRRASKLRWYLPAEAPEPPGNVLVEREIATIAAKKAAEEILADKALDDLVTAERAALRAKDPEQQLVLRERRQAAESVFRDARARVESTNARLSDVQRGRDELRRRAALAQTITRGN
jgi:hypothetical protein